jgi:hypothetical protein
LHLTCSSACSALSSSAGWLLRHPTSASSILNSTQQHPTSILSPGSSATLIGCASCGPWYSWQLCLHFSVVLMAAGSTAYLFVL